MRRVSRSTAVVDERWVLYAIDQSNPGTEPLGGRHLWRSFAGTASIDVAGEEVMPCPDCIGLSHERLRTS
jgi:hypothetical protein